MFKKVLSLVLTLSLLLSLGITAFAAYENVEAGLTVKYDNKTANVYLYLTEQVEIADVSGSFRLTDEESELVVSNIEYAEGLNAVSASKQTIMARNAMGAQPAELETGKYWIAKVPVDISNATPGASYDVSVSIKYIADGDGADIVTVSQPLTTTIEIEAPEPEKDTAAVVKTLSVTKTDGEYSAEGTAKGNKTGDEVAVSFEVKKAGSAENTYVITAKTEVAGIKNVTFDTKALELVFDFETTSSKVNSANVTFAVPEVQTELEVPTEASGSVNEEAAAEAIAEATKEQEAALEKANEAVEEAEKAAADAAAAKTEADQAVTEAEAEVAEAKKSGDSAAEAAAQKKLNEAKAAAEKAEKDAEKAAAEKAAAEKAKADAEGSKKLTEELAKSLSDENAAPSATIASDEANTAALKAQITEALTTDEKGKKNSLSDLIDADVLAALGDVAKDDVKIESELNIEATPKSVEKKGDFVNVTVAMEAIVSSKAVTTNGEGTEKSTALPDKSVSLKGVSIDLKIPVAESLLKQVASGEITTETDAWIVHSGKQLEAKLEKSGDYWNFIREDYTEGFSDIIASLQDQAIGMVGEDEYTNLQDAIDAAKETKQTVVLDAEKAAEAAENNPEALEAVLKSGSVTIKDEAGLAKVYKDDAKTKLRTPNKNGKYTSSSGGGTSLDDILTTGGTGGTGAGANTGNQGGAKPTTPADVLDPYTDVNKDEWYAPALRYVISNEYMTGVGDTEFGPDMTISRAMIAKLLANMAKVDTTPAAGEKWYDKAVEWAVKNNIFDGTNPEAPALREEFATMLYNYVKTTGKGYAGDWSYTLTNPDANDVQAANREAMQWMVTNKVINGMDAAGTLAPQSTTTRAQFAQMLLNLSNVK